MYIFLAVILAVFGLFMIFAPGAVYELTEMWKSRDNGEPSDSYIFWMKVRGVIVLLGSIAGIIGLAVLYYRGEM